MLAEVLLALAAAYAAVGLVVGVAFLLFGLSRSDVGHGSRSDVGHGSRSDPAAAGAYAFRPLLLPGLALFWPLVLRRWRRGAGSGGAEAMRRRHRSAHLRLWLALAVILPGLLLAAAVLRQPPEAGGPPLRISAP